MTEPTTNIAAGDHIDKALKGELLDGIVQPSGYTTMRGAASYLQDLGINDGITRDVLANNHTVTQAEFDATNNGKLTASPIANGPRNTCRAISKRSGR